MRFLGVGISTAVGLAMFTIIMIILLKIAVNKYDMLKPVQDIVNTI